jgi:hypothetical protein
MSKTLSVKIKTSVLLEALEKALAEREKRYANNEKEQAAYDKEREAWLGKVSKMFAAKKPEDIEICSLFSQRDGTVRVSARYTIKAASLPPEPERPEKYNEWEYRREAEEINNAIRVLKLTEQEFVNASTMAKVSQYL